MKRLKGPLRAVIGNVAVAAATLSGYYLYRLASLAAAYKAKILCSGLFVAQRDAASILENDLAIEDLRILRHINTGIDYQQKVVTAEVFGIIKRSARYTPGLGCSLCYPSYPTPPATRSGRLAAPTSHPLEGDGVLNGAPLLDNVLTAAFSDPDPKHRKATRAILIMRRGRIVAERYAPGFTKDTPLLGWSMTKSVMNALVGILVQQGRLSLDEPAPVPEWRRPGDPRRNITLNHLLQMSSGLRFREHYRNPLQDVIYMLLASPDMASYAAGKPLQVPPGTKWSYSSGTTNIISRIIRFVVGERDYLDFPYRALFDRIGMTSAVLETDATGTFVGSSYMYATARDWARFGQLYLQEGVWGGEQLLPQGWVTYSTTPAPQAPDRQYGAHFWLKMPQDFSSGDAAVTVPADAFHAVGHEGQLLTVIPSKELVVVRLGLTRDPGVWLHDRFIEEVANAF